MLEAGANPNLSDSNGLTAIWWAVIFSASKDYSSNIGKPVATKALLDAGASFTFPEYFKSTFGRFHPDIVALLIERGWNAYKGSGDFLFWAAARDNLAVVQVLLAAGADANMPESSLYLVGEGASFIYPLQAAASAADIEIVAALLKAGADPNKSWHGDVRRHPMSNAKGECKESLAPQQRRLEIVKLLLASGADPRLEYSYVGLLGGRYKTSVSKEIKDFVKACPSPVRAQMLRLIDGKK